MNELLGAQVLIIDPDDKTILMLLRKPRSKWYTLCCIGRKRHYRKDGSCKHTEELMANLVPDVRKRTKLDGFGGKAPNYYSTSK